MHVVIARLAGASIWQPRERLHQNGVDALQHTQAHTLSLAHKNRRQIQRQLLLNGVVCVTRSFFLWLCISDAESARSSPATVHLFACGTTDYLPSGLVGRIDR